MFCLESTVLRDVTILGYKYFFFIITQFRRILSLCNTIIELDITTCKYKKKHFVRIAEKASSVTE